MSVYIPVAPEQCQLMDVALFSGDSDIDKAIKLCSGSQYTHAAAITKKGMAGAGMDGYKDRTLADTITSDDQYVSIVRFVGDPGNIQETQLGSSAFPAEPVIAANEAILAEGDMYGYDSLLLLAAICEVRRLTNPDAYQTMMQDSIFLRIIEAIESTNIFQLIQTISSRGKVPMVCSAAMYRIFSAAGEQYRPTILPESMKTMFDNISMYDSQLLNKLSQIHLQETGMPFQFITPGDLAMSPSFAMRVGRLQYGTLET